MASTLGRLFGKARENFTTEALAGAIRSDPRPFLAALGESVASPVLAVQTQVPIFGTSGRGFLDLVLELGPDDSRRRYWVEVKVEAGEHGCQIANYLSAICKLPEEGRPKLLILSPRQLRIDVRWVSWQDVRRGIEHSTPVNLYWSDFKSYLQEIGMADTYSEPIAPAELTALKPAGSLLGKVARFLAPFAASAPSIWPSASWPVTEWDIRKVLGKHLVSHGTLAMGSVTASGAGVGVGVYHDEDTADAWLGLWIWMNPRRIIERGRVWSQADLGGLDGTTWFRDTTWQFLGAYRRLGDFRNANEATAWLLDHLRELNSSQVLGLLPNLGAMPPGEEDAEAEAEGGSDP